MLEPKIDVLVLGVGEVAVSPEFSKKILALMRKYKINVEILATEQVKKISPTFKMIPLKTGLFFA